MASSAAMQSILGSPLAGQRSLKQMMPANHAARLLIDRSPTRVKCLAEDGDKEVTADTPSQSTSIPPPPPPQAKDLLAFSGPGPERINGRLAMIGFVAALGVEFARRQDLFSQINEGGGL